MSTLLAKLGIPVAEGFSPEHVPPDCDTVVVGNAALRDNVEAAEAARRGLAVLSLPQAVRQYLLPGRTSVVITGTHGKTTTSALTAWLLLDAGRDPGFLVGGEMRNLGNGYRRGRGAPFVLEGDEYNAAFFDRGPKFLHYAPRHLFVGNIEYDHADLYPDLASVIDAFRKVMRLVRRGVGLNADDPASWRRPQAARPSCGRARAPGATSRRATSWRRRHRFHTLEAGLPTVRCPPCSASTTCGTPSGRSRSRGLGLSAGEIARSLARFEGVRRRMEVKGEKRGILVVDDFAHHPTAVRGTIAAARARFPGRRLWALFEPRSNTAGRKMFEDDYADAFSAADALVVAPVFHAQRLGPDNQLDRAALVARLRPRQARLRAGNDREIPEVVRRDARPGDVLLLMSSGPSAACPSRCSKTCDAARPLRRSGVSCPRPVRIAPFHRRNPGRSRRRGGTRRPRGPAPVGRLGRPFGQFRRSVAPHESRIPPLPARLAAAPARRTTGRTAAFSCSTRDGFSSGWPRRQARSGGDSVRPRPCFSCSGSWHVRPCAIARTT
jgi:UDP-N-acetylmuramate: L-alanyl-gamma-D-glutamyl-meso-diaminopimelate ligase